MKDSPSIRTMTSKDRAWFGQCMTAGFLGDPSARYLWPKLESFMAVFPEYSLLYQGSAIKDGTSLMCADYSGAVTWLAPGKLPDGDAIKSLALETCDIGRRDEIEWFFNEADSVFPQEPCWYLPLIGVDPARMNRGLGGELMKRSLEMVDSDNGVAYLESSNPRNIEFYRQFGFEPLAAISLGGAELFTPMLRARR